MTAAKAGYLSTQYGQRRPYESGTVVNITGAPAINGIAFALPAESVIAGKITDGWGEPLPRVHVQALRARYDVAGQRRLTGVQTAVTDDRGEFRLFGLPEGRYLVSARRRTGMSLDARSGADADAQEPNAPIYFPGTEKSIEAVPVVVSAGEQYPLQFALVPQRLQRVSGTVRDSAGGVPVGTQLRFVTRLGDRDSLLAHISATWPYGEVGLDRWSRRH